MLNQTGQTLGHYHILEQLGEGGMATVYRAFDTRMNRDVAVKIIRLDQFPPASLARILKRFEREARTLARLTHPNIVSLIDYGEHQGVPYLVMVYLPGGTLKDKMGKPIFWIEAARMLLPVMKALAYAHAEGIIHRDVKPNNILLTRSGDPMLSDFGIAKMLDSSETQTLTGTGVGIGTPEYMAPEQGLGKEIDARADIYSLGVVFFEMITGQKPFTADTPMAVIFKHMSNPLPRPGSFVKDLPSSVEKVIIKALAKKAADRYASMDDFAAELEGLIARYDKKKSAPPPLKKAPAAPQLVDPDITIDALPVHGQPWGGNENSANAYSSTAPKKLRTANIRFLLVATGIAFLIGLVIWWGKFTAVNILQTSPVTPRISTAQNNSQVATAENTPLPAPPSIVVETLSLPAWTFTPLATDTKQAITLPSPTFSPTSTFTPPATRTPTYTLPPPTTYAPTRLVSPTWTYTPSVTITPGSRPLPEQTSSPSSGNIPVETGFGIGSTTLRAKDGMTMVYVPAGSFTMGSKDGPADEKPAHQVTLDAFWIDQTEVTNGMWALCVQARGCQLPAIKRSYTRPDYYGNPQYNDYPVVSVNWSQAKGYCEWTGSRLPTEAEWEKAARGTDDRTYPWGEGIDQTYANYDGTIGDTTRVASYEKGKSLYGAYDLAGNTLEWVADLYSDNYYWWSRTSNPTGPTSGIYRVQRGGWWNANNQEARSSSRVAWDPGLNNAGLRCARSTFP